MTGERMTTAEIRRIRERLNLTQIELAEKAWRCAKGRPVIGKKGIRNPTGPAIRLLRMLAENTPEKPRSSVDSQGILCNISSR